MLQELKKLFDLGETPDMREDIAFMPDVEAAIRKSGAKFAYWLTMITSAVIVALLVWAALATLDEVTKGDAQVIPSSKIQVVQSLDGGNVEEILVKEGAIVEKDQILMRLENINANATLGEKAARANYLTAMVARLNAEISETPLVFSDDLKKAAPNAITDQVNQYNARRSQRDAELAVLQSETMQKSQEVREMGARLTQLRDNLQLKQQELDMRAPLVAQGAMSKVELLRTQGEVTDLKGEMNTIQTSVPRAQEAVSEAQRHITEVRTKYKADAQQELATAKAELDSLSQVLTAGEDKVKKTVLRSPVRGTMKQIKLNTIGGVVKPGEDIMEIVPLGDTLLFEAKIPPKDIAFIRPGQEVNIKITAYDYSIFGGLKGVVEDISADTIQNEKGESFYRVNIRSHETVLMHKGKPLPIIPGMTANVQILTGRKSVLDYLLKPIMKARQEALRER